MIVNQNAPAFFIDQINALLDTGKFDHISTSEVRQHATARNTLEWLTSVAPKQFDGSLFGSEGPYTWFGPYLNDFLESMVNVSDDSRHYGVNNRGLCLLVAWVCELIRKGDGWKPTENIPRSFQNE
jgi:hypothetical protein